MAHPVEQPFVAGKHPVDFSHFKASSEDGQYQPFDTATETLRLGSSQSLDGVKVAGPAMEDKSPPTMGPETGVSTTGPSKGWKDLPPSPAKSVPRLH